MPLSGNLNELPFPEILRLLRDRTGKVEIADKLTGERFSFFLSAGKLVSAFEGAGPIPDALALHSVIQRLSINERAFFLFEENPTGERTGPLSIPVEQILLSSLAALRSPERYAAYLPHPDARFRAAAQATPWLTEDLLTFWVSAERFLRSGISANEIAHVLGIPLPQVLLELFKLRLLGVIVPIQPPLAPAMGSAARAASIPELPAAPSPPAPIASSPPGMPSLPKAAPPRSLLPPAPNPSSAELAASPQKPATPRPGVLARIAAGLRGLLEKMYE